MSRTNSIISLSEPGKKLIFLYFHTYKHLKVHAHAELSMIFVTLEPGTAGLRSLLVY